MAITLQFADASDVVGMLMLSQLLLLPLMLLLSLATACYEITVAAAIGDVVYCCSVLYVDAILATTAIAC
jgi:hypothetical protein